MHPITSLLDDQDLRFLCAHRLFHSSRAEPFPQLDRGVESLHGNQCARWLVAKCCYCPGGGDTMGRKDNGGESDWEGKKERNVFLSLLLVCVTLFFGSFYTLKTVWSPIGSASSSRSTIRFSRARTFHKHALANAGLCNRAITHPVGCWEPFVVLRGLVQSPFRTLESSQSAPTTWDNKDLQLELESIRYVTISDFTTCSSEWV